MSEQVKSKTCVFCHGILFEEDDVVICPECGAPHHRDCWHKAGKCALEEFHGTERQYDIAAKKLEQDREKEIEQARLRGEIPCPECGAFVAERNLFCPHCGNAMPKAKAAAPQGQPFNPLEHLTSLGDIDKNEELEKGVTAEEIGVFLGVRTSRYAPKFKQNRKACWNWVAFLVPSAWYAFHKMYKYMAAALGAFFAGLICFAPMISEIEAALSTLPLAQTSAEEADQLSKAVALALQNGKPSSFLLFLLGFAIISATMLLSGFFAERSYRQTAIEKILAVKSNESIEDPRTEIAKKGGTNLFLALIMLLILIYPDVIISLVISLL